MVLQAMAETGADPATTVVVGDTTFDMEMARAAGAAAIGVAWGYHEPDRLATAGAQQIAADAAELARLLNAYTRADAAAAR
jgi:phosphoglycolate phosphatase